MSGAGNTLFSDELARKTIATQFDLDLFVEAGAGSGKTFSLVSRAVGLIVEGITTIDRLVIITFTESAADELRARIRVRLEQYAQGDDEIGGQRAQSAISSIANSQICTIHGFAKLLLEAGEVFTETSVVIDSAEDIRLLNAWSAEALREKWSAQNDDDVLRIGLLRQIGVNSRQWLLLIEQLHKNWHLCRQRQSADNKPPDVVLLRDQVRDAAQKLIDLTQTARSDSDSMVRFVEESLAPWAHDAQGQSAVVALMQLRRFPLTRKALGNKNNWNPDQLEAARSSWESIKQSYSSSMVGVYDQLLNWALAASQEIVLSLADQRMNSQLYNFHDLLARCMEMLADDSRAVVCASSYSHVFVDEFQDTDPLQWAIISRLVEKIGGQGTLFVVGDPHQSIYRFRGADVSTFNSVRNERESSVLSLTTSFRSREILLTEINRAAASLFGGETFVRLQAGRESSLEVESVIILDEQHDAKTLAEDVRLNEAHEVAEKITKLMSSAQVHDEATGELRPARYGDVALLMPSRIALSAAQTALTELNIPHRVESPILMWNTQELRDLTNILRVIGDSSDEVALVAALRSPYFGLNDAELLEYRRGGGVWDVFATSSFNEAIDQSRVGHAVNFLAELSKRVRFLGVSEAVSTVVGCIQANQIASSVEDHELSNRVSFLIHSARNYERRPLATLRGFCDWAETQRDDRALAYEYPTRSSQGNAVRIMTIHAAKGLEFPIVVVVGLQSRGAPPMSVRVLWNEGRPELRVGGKDLGIQTMGFSQCDEIDKAEARAEERRLFYVAMTRARDYLVVSLRRKSRAAGIANEVAEFLI